MTAAPMQAVKDLSEAFAARDVDLAMACFVPDNEVGYVGSELGETATTREGLSTMLTDLFKREEAYSWQPTTVTVHKYGETTAYLFAEADGLARPDEGDYETFPYRVSGLVELTDGRWLWRHCQGCEPTQ